MTILGIILLIVGGAMSALLITGAAPQAVLDLPVPLPAWVVVAVVGVVFLILGRRPAN